MCISRCWSISPSSPILFSFPSPSSSRTTLANKTIVILRIALNLYPLYYPILPIHTELFLDKQQVCLRSPHRYCYLALLLFHRLCLLPRQEVTVYLHHLPSPSLQLHLQRPHSHSVMASQVLAVISFKRSKHWPTVPCPTVHHQLPSPHRVSHPSN